MWHVKETRFMFRLIVFMLGVLLLSSCKNEESSFESTVMPENLEGRWSVISATRNNRPAPSLAKAEFKITRDSFSTNFLPDKKPYLYSFDGEVIQLMNDKKTSFKVLRTHRDTLLLSSIIKNFEFKFVTVQIPQDVEA